MFEITHSLEILLVCSRSSMNLKTLGRILHMWIGCCLDFIFLGDHSLTCKCSSVLNLSVECPPCCLLDWYLKFCSLKNFNIETSLILQEFHHSHLLRVPLGNGTSESAVRALLKALNSSGFFFSFSAECSFSLAASLVEKRLRTTCPLQFYFSDNYELSFLLAGCARAKLSLIFFFSFFKLNLWSSCKEIL